MNHICLISCPSAPGCWCHSVGANAAVVGVVTFGVVLTEIGWRIIRHGTVMAHEGAHAVADTLLFRHVEYIELNWDATGGTMPKHQGGCLVSVIAAFVGYIGPSSFGLGAAKLIQLGYAVTVLWLTFFLLGLLLLLLRPSYGRVTVIMTGVLVFAVLRYSPGFRTSSGSSSGLPPPCGRSPSAAAG